jgi:hypothetical protein
MPAAVPFATPPGLGYIPFRTNPGTASANSAQPIARWNPIDYPINKFLLCGAWSPGICIGPQNAAIVRKLDERGGMGLDQPFLIYTGRRLALFQTKIILLDKGKTEQEVWADWYKFSYLLSLTPHNNLSRFGPLGTPDASGYTPGAALVIWHPQLARLGITMCAVEEEPQEEREEDYWTVTIKFHQVAKGPPKQGYGKATQPKQDDANSPLDQGMKDRLDRLLQRMNNGDNVDKAAK